MKIRTRTCKAKRRPIRPDALAVVAKPEPEIVRRKVDLRGTCAAVYLASMGSETSRSSIYDALKRVVRVLTKEKFSIKGHLVNVENFPWEKIRYRHMQVIRADLAGQTLSPSTVNHTLSAVRGVLKVAWNQRLISTDDYQRACSVKGIKGSRVQAGRHIEDAELKKLFDACTKDLSGVRDAAMLSVLYGCAMRRAEVAGVMLETLDMEKHSIRLVGKGNKERVLYLPEWAVEPMNKWLELRGSGPGPIFVTISSGGRGADRGKVTTKGISDEVIRKAIRKLEKRAKLKQHITPHDLRRTSFGNLLEAGVDISTVQKIAGHSSPNTTSRYDRRGEKTRKRAASMLEVPFGKKNKNEPNSEPSSICEHPMWKTIRPYFDERPHERRGLEVRKLPEDMSMRLQQLELPCCTCARPIKVFRRRQGTDWSHLYYSPACPSAQSPGCSRGIQCRDEMDRIRLHLLGTPRSTKSDE